VDVLAELLLREMGELKEVLTWSCFIHQELNTKMPVHNLTNNLTFCLSAGRLGYLLIT
jgi:hypothetical protein